PNRTARRDGQARPEDRRARHDGAARVARLRTRAPGALAPARASRGPCAEDRRVLQRGTLIPDDPRRRVLERSEEHTSELQSRGHLVCRLLLGKKKKRYSPI